MYSTKTYAGSATAGVVRRVHHACSLQSFVDRVVATGDGDEDLTAVRVESED